ncbi:MAG: dihydrolipoyllysine-residue succinyltransferase component of 2-oxoglutarate dehydrogenase complex [Phycisphaerae bacterium]|nr:MAG: dihydrolipoyllysine-residue succinyltransferase component of 2-oxoglutarate dehydrogenase complex [Phycisphaerae bacterium]
MAVDIVIPQAGESVTSGVIARWVKAPGQAVKRDEVVLELETDKVTMEVVSPADGVLSVLAQAGETVAIGQKVGTVDGSATATVVGAKPAQTQAAAASTSASAPAVAVAAPPAHAEGANGDVRATPLARKIAAEHGVDLSRVQGTGAGGRVREQDVLAAVEARKAAATPAPAAKPETPAARPAPVAGSRGVTRERMSPLRQRVAQRLVQSQHTAAILTTFNEVDMTAVMDLRKQYKEDFEKKHGVGLGFMSFFVKAAVAALRHMPVANSYIVEEQGVPMIERHDYCDVAVAVSTPKGLMVPVLRNAESMTFADVEKSLKDLATRARDGKIELAELQGGTFTISNGGVFGSLMGTPIINPPQSAILGMHAIKNRAVEWPVGSGQVAIRPMMYLALSYDHRLLDGADAVQFLVKVKQCIEDPQRLLLGV